MTRELWECIIQTRSTPHNSGVFFYANKPAPSIKTSYKLLTLGSVYYIHKGERVDYIKKKIRRGWIVVNCRNGKHSHFKSEYGCYLIIKFLRAGIYPDNRYLQVSYDRLKNNKEKKDRFYKRRW